MRVWINHNYIFFKNYFLVRRVALCLYNDDKAGEHLTYQKSKKRRNKLIEENEQDWEDWSEDDDCLRISLFILYFLFCDAIYSSCDALS